MSFQSLAVREPGTALEGGFQVALQESAGDLSN